MVMVREITETTEMPYDLVDDTCMHMRNDSAFYRNEYFPTMAKIADMQREGTNTDPRKTLMPMIEKGITDYCTKYRLTQHPDDMYNNEHRAALYDKIYQEEMQAIEQGDYA
jgi:hypothetical protein|tara:strand:+ start:559 stop:891 length:333 start_codon:yes stop_codon:yes gene_type:complete